MEPIQGNILVSVNPYQKENTKIGDNILKTGKNYNENFRERNPVVAYVESGVKEIPTGSNIVCNYSHFDLESPFQITDTKYSIPINEEIYAIINKDGTLNPIMDNVLVERVTKESILEIPEELKKNYTNRGILLTETDNIKSGSYIFWLTMSDYEIVYTWKGVERRALKIHKSEITGYLK